MAFKGIAMLKKTLLLQFILLFHCCAAITTYIKKSKCLEKNCNYFVYGSLEFELRAHVLTLSLNSVDCTLMPALGQREEVSNIAKRCNAFCAVNGSNYRRGGKYNGNRVNLLYLNQQVYSDLNLIRGSFCWNNKTKSAIIDKVFLKTKLTINNQSFPVDQINQPRALGQSVLYTEVADIYLLAHTPGKNIIINDKGFIHDITHKFPTKIPHNWYVCQIDSDCQILLQKGMSATCDFKLQSYGPMNNHHYNEYDFVLGGAGLLLQSGIAMVDHLYKEFSQGNAIVHCNDEVAADFHTKEMQEWLIEKRHPRSAIGITYNNELVIVVIDGRQKNSEGLTLKELASLMQQLGCRDALNIGGGGCSTLYVENEVANNPSVGTERPVSEAVCFLKIDE